MAYQSWRTQPQLQLASSVLNCVQEDAILRSHGPQAHLQVIISTLQGGSYVFEQFLEAALRPWMDPDKIFLIKKIT